MYGNVQDLEGGKISFYVKNNGYYGMSFMVANNSADIALRIAVDCSKSINAMSHRGSLVSHDHLEPGEDMLVHHLMPLRSGVPWSCGYDVSYSWV